MLILTALGLMAATAFPFYKTHQGSYGTKVLLVGLLGQEALCLNNLPLEASKLTLNTGVTFSSTVFVAWATVLVTALMVLDAWLEQGAGPMLIAVVGGGAFLSAAQNTLLFIVTLELQSYATYVCVALGAMPNQRSTGVSTYFLVGAAATTGLILGWGWIFRTGALTFPLESGEASGGQQFQMAGLMAKTGCFPFYAWLPAAYGGLEYAGLSALAVLPPVAIFMQISGVTGLGLHGIYVTASSSVFVGSLLSSSATATRRLLAFSGTAHAGYILAATPFTGCPLLVYNLAYGGIFILLCSTLVACVGPKGLYVSDLRGALSLYLLQGWAFSAAALSMGGVPPLVGFYTKASVLLGWIGLGGGPGPLLLLLFAGAVGIIAYLRLGLTVAGYPQSYGYYVQPSSSSRGGFPALFLGVLVFSETLVGSFAVSVFG